MFVFVVPRVSQTEFDTTYLPFLRRVFQGRLHILVELLTLFDFNALFRFVVHFDRPQLLPSFPCLIDIHPGLAVVDVVLVRLAVLAHLGHEVAGRTVKHFVFVALRIDRLLGSAARLSGVRGISGDPVDACVRVILRGEAVP